MLWCFSCVCMCVCAASSVVHSPRSDDPAATYTTARVCLSQKRKVWEFFVFSKRVSALCRDHWSTSACMCAWATSVRRRGRENVREFLFACLFPMRKREERGETTWRSRNVTCLREWEWIGEGEVEIRAQGSWNSGFFAKKNKPLKFKFWKNPLKNLKFKKPLQPKICLNAINSVANPSLVVSNQQRIRIRSGEWEKVKIVSHAQGLCIHSLTHPCSNAYSSVFTWIFMCGARTHRRVEWQQTAQPRVCENFSHTRYTYRKGSIYNIMRNYFFLARVPFSSHTR
jgi:hypothetical protein